MVPDHLEICPFSLDVLQPFEKVPTYPFFGSDINKENVQSSVTKLQVRFPCTSLGLQYPCLPSCVPYPPFFFYSADFRVGIVFYHSQGFLSYPFEISHSEDSYLWISCRPDWLPCKATLFLSLNLLYLNPKCLKSKARPSYVNRMVFYRCIFFFFCDIIPLCTGSPEDESQIYFVLTSSCFFFLVVSTSFGAFLVFAASL